MYEGDDFKFIHQLIDDVKYEVEMIRRQQRGSRVGRSENIEWNRALEASKLFTESFSPNPTYPDHLFYRRFRVPSSTFVEVCENMQTKYFFFHLCKDAPGTYIFNAYKNAQRRCH